MQSVRQLRSLPEYTDKVDDQGHGTAFEEAFARRNGLDRVPGSGNQWASKLDVEGLGARWTLKSTKFRSFPLSLDVIQELLEACEGVGGTGEIPMGAVELDNRHTKETIVFMRESDFNRIQQEQISLTRETKADARRREATVPQLLREE